LKKFIGVLLFAAMVTVAAPFVIHGRISDALPTAGSANNPMGASTAESEKYSPAQASGADVLLVNASNPLPKGFVPSDLINLYDQKGKLFQLAKSNIKLSRPVYNAMQAMFAAADKDGVDGFILTSGYRTAGEQSDINSSITDGTAAKPGQSEHETGLAFDITAKGNPDFSRTPQFAWLAAHCGEYGFILRYPKDSESFTGLPYEPWHYRYVGLPHSQIIMQKGITLEEYLD
jgi:D-alanyl-D-alanine carboxypeptidase